MSLQKLEPDTWKSKKCICKIKALQNIPWSWQHTKQPRNQHKMLRLEQRGSTSFWSCQQGIEGFSKETDMIKSQSFVKKH